MPITPTYPGVYVLELPSSTHTITGVSTSTTAFIDFFPQGPTRQAVQINSFAEFQRTYGGLDARSEASYGIMQYYLNGGGAAYVVRVVPADAMQAAVDSAPSNAIFPYGDSQYTNPYGSSPQFIQVGNGNQTLGYGESILFTSNIPGDVLYTLSVPGSAPYPYTAQQQPQADDTNAGIGQGNYGYGLGSGSAPNLPPGVGFGVGTGSGSGTGSGTSPQGLYFVPDALGNVRCVQVQTETTGPVPVTIATLSPHRDATTGKVTGALLTCNALPTMAPTDLLTPNLSPSVNLVVTAWSEESSASSISPENHCVVQLVQPVVNSVSPNLKDASLTFETPGPSQAFTADFFYAPRGVAWSLQGWKLNESGQSTWGAFGPEHGVIDAKTGVYTPPAKVPSQSLFYVVATSLDSIAAAAAFPSNSPNAAQILDNGLSMVPVSLIPFQGLTLQTWTPTLSAGQSALVYAQDSDPNDPSNPNAPVIPSGAQIKWSFTGNDNSMSINGQSSFVGNPFVFDPQAIDNLPTISPNESMTFVIKGTSTAIPGESHVADLTLVFGDPYIACPTITDTPPMVELGRGAQFGLMVGEKAFSTSATVDWSIVSGPGILGDDGFYKAPNSALPQTSVAVQAVIDFAEGPLTLTYAFALKSPQTRLTIKAYDEGVWGNRLQAIAYQSPMAASLNTFSLQARLVDPMGNVLASESYSGLNWNPDDPMYCIDVVNDASSLVQLVDNGPDTDPPYYYPGRTIPSDAPWLNLSGGTDGTWQPSEYPQALTAMLDPDGSPLTQIAPNIFNLLCLPGAANLDANSANAVWTNAAAFCVNQRALLLIDPPLSQIVPSPNKAIAWYEALEITQTQKECAATYWPRINIPDPLKNYRNREVGPSGTMAGVYATTDIQRGVWKAPAGIGAGLAGAVPTYPLKDSENGNMNPLGLNAIRNFPVYGVVSWGARTVAGADELSDQYKYIPVRRLAQYIENSLFNGLKWAVFEPNGPILWAAIRQDVGDFMTGLLRQGAFAGSSPSSAFFVNCDEKTTTATDIANGIVNVIVGFAPLEPAEFIIVQIEQIAGQSS